MIDLSSCRLHGDGWSLRTLQEWDQDELANLLADRDLLRQSGLVVPSSADGLAFAWAVRQLSSRVDLVGIFVDQHLAGLVSLTAEGEQVQKAELGYLLAQPFRGHGIMSAAVSALLTWLSANTTLKQLIAHTHVNNEPSIHVLQRCHFSIVDEHDAAALLTWQYQLKQIRRSFDDRA